MRDTYGYPVNLDGKEAADWMEHVAAKLEKTFRRNLYRVDEACSKAMWLRQAARLIREEFVLKQPNPVDDMIVNDLEESK